MAPLDAPRLETSPRSCWRSPRDHRAAAGKQRHRRREDLARSGPWGRLELGQGQDMASTFVKEIIFFDTFLSHFFHIFKLLHFFLFSCCYIWSLMDSTNVHYRLLNDFGGCSIALS